MCILVGLPSILSAEPVPESDTASASILDDTVSIPDDNDDADVEHTVVVADRVLLLNTDQLLQEIMTMIPLVQNDVNALAMVLGFWNSNAVRKYTDVNGSVPFAGSHYELEMPKWRARRRRRKRRKGKGSQIGGSKAGIG